MKGSRLPLTHSEHRMSVSGRKKRSSSNFPFDFFFFSYNSRSSLVSGEDEEGGGAAPAARQHHRLGIKTSDVTVTISIMAIFFEHLNNYKL